MRIRSIFARATRALPLGNSEFDVVLAITVLGHVPHAEQVIPELVRVTRPGGRIGVLDNDADSLIIAHPDRVLTRRIVAARSDYGFTNGWMARQLSGLLAEAGLREVKVRAFASLERGPATFLPASRNDPPTSPCRPGSSLRTNSGAG